MKSEGRRAKKDRPFGPSVERKEVQQVPPVEGQTKVVARRRANTRVAWNADAAAFKKTFLAAFRLKD